MYACACNPGYGGQDCDQGKMYISRQCIGIILIAMVTIKCENESHYYELICKIQMSKINRLNESILMKSY